MKFNKNSMLERELRSKLARDLKSSRSARSLIKEGSITDTLSNFFESNYQKVTAKLEELLTGDQMQRLVTEKLVPSIEEPINSFIDRHKDKKDDYLKNPSLLMEDIENDFPLVKILGYLDDILVAAFIGSAAYTVWLSVFGPAGLAAGALAEAGKYFARRALREFVKKEGKQYLKKIVANITLKKLKSLAVAGALTIPKALLLEATRQASYLLVLDVVISVVKDLGFEVVKLALIKEGTRKFGLPEELVSKVATTDSKDALTRILTNAKDRILDDLTKLFSTMEGFQRLALGAALNKFYSMAFPGKKASILATNAKLHLFDLVNEPGFKKDLEKAKGQVSTKLEQITPELKASKLKLEKFLEEQFNQNKLPLVLLTPFKNIILKNEENLKDETRGEKETKKLVENSKFLEDEIKDNYREIALIEFIDRNFKRLAKSPEALQQLLDDALDQKRANLEILMDQAEIDNPSDFFKEAIRQKRVLLLVLLKKLAKGEERLEKLGEQIEEKLDLESYKRNLEKEVFGYE